MKLFRVAIGIFLLISMFAAPASSGCINVDFEIKKGSRQFIYDASSYMLSSFINKMDDMSTDNKWAFSLDCNAMVPEQVAGTKDPIPKTTIFRFSSQNVDKKYGLFS